MPILRGLKLYGILYSQDRSLHSPRGKPIQYMELAPLVVTVTHGSELATVYAIDMAIDQVSRFDGNAIISLKLAAARTRQGFAVTITGVIVKTKGYRHK
jgi:hypothetical protein